MKRELFGKRGTIVLLAVACLALLVSCGKKKDVLTEKDDPEEVLKAANEQYAKEELRGSHGTYTYIYQDGSSEEETVDVTFDEAEKIEQLVYTSGDEEFLHYNVREEDGDYTYILDPETNAWLRYAQEPDEEGKTTYEVQKDGEIYQFDEESGFANVKYSNEGEETLEGKETIKIKVTGESATNSEGTDSITRESILEEYELTEEAIGYIDGLSEALDKYVAALNASENEGNMTFEAYIWVEKDTCRPLQNETTWDMGNTNDSQIADDMSDFEDNSWKAYSVMSDLENGLSVEEALRNVEESEDAMEEEMEAEEELMDGEEYLEDDSMSQKEMIIKEVRLYGEDCTAIDELPEYYTEITEEEYYNGEY